MTPESQVIQADPVGGGACPELLGVRPFRTPWDRSYPLGLRRDGGNLLKGSRRSSFVIRHLHED